MKKALINFLTYLTVGAIIVVLLLVFGTEEGVKHIYKGNTQHKPITIKPKTYQCSECKMDIENLEYLAELITIEGDTYFFDDIGCVILWLEKHQPHISKILTQTLDTHKWIEAKQAWYSRISPSPMGYGFGAVEKKREKLISYDEMKTLMLQGKNLHDPFVKKQLLGD